MMRKRTVSLTLILTLLTILTWGAGEVCKGREVYPAKNIQLVVQYNPGGGWDSYARAMSPYLKKYLPRKVNIIVANRPGGGGRVGNTYAYKSRPDGYTVGFISIPGAIVTAMLSKVEYDVTKCGWIHTFARDPIVMFVKGDSEINSFDDLKALAEKRSVKECSTGLGNTIDVISTIVFHKAGMKYRTISGYKGSRDATVGMLRGDGDFVTVPGSGFALKYVKSGDFKPILAMSDSRVDLYPDVPSAGELGLSPVPSWIRCVFVPPGTPKERIKTLDTAFAKTLKDADFLEWAKKSGRVVTSINSEKTAKEVMKSVDLFLKYEDVLKEHLRPK
jgi:tripartite-type tricarboxylate transporter receptor subunit TctC